MLGKVTASFHIQARRIMNMRRKRFVLFVPSYCLTLHVTHYFLARFLARALGAEAGAALSLTVPKLAKRVPWLSSS
jgi:hypothetical protein